MVQTVTNCYILELLPRALHWGGCARIFGQFNTINFHIYCLQGFLHGGAADGSSGSCASGYQRYEGTCYRAYGDRKSYDDAKAKCAADGGRLVAPKTERLDTFIMGLVQANGGGDHWIGLDDRASEGVWTFSDGTQMQVGGTEL